MVRVQAQLTEEQAARLRRLGAARGVSVAALLREGADRVLAEDSDDREESWRRFWKGMESAGSSGLGDVAREHDRYLDDAFGR